MNNKLLYKVIKISHDNLYKIDSRFKHFTFIAERNNIICWGFNKAWKSHPLAYKFAARFNCIHSELDAIKKFPYAVKHLSEYTLINIRMLKNGKIGTSKPCLSCNNLLQHFGIKEIYYSTQFGFQVLNIGEHDAF